jgi:hypothetical protein
MKDSMTPKERKIMKRDAKHLASGTLFIALGTLIAAGPQYLFKICEQTHGPHGGVTNCWWSAQAEIGVGSVIALIGISYVVVKGARALAGLSLALAFNGTLAFLIPNVLTGMCEHAHMHCRLVTLPAINILSLVTVAAAAVNAAWLFRRSGMERNLDEAA